MKNIKTDIVAAYISISIGAFTLVVAFLWVMDWLPSNYSETSDLFTILAVVVGILTVIVLRNQHESEKSHNKLSLRPIINMVYEKSVHFDKEQQASIGTLKIVLINNGTGPAIVERFDLFVDNEPIVAKDDQKWEYAQQKLFALDTTAKPKYFGYGTFNLSKGYCIPSRERLTLFTVQYTMNMDQQTQKSIDRSRAILVYRSLHRDTYTYDSDKVKRGEYDLFED